MRETRSTIKAEPVDSIPTIFVSLSHAQTISSISSTTPLPETMVSSGDTTVADDTLMTDMNAHGTSPRSSSDGTMEVDGSIAATSTPMVSQATQPLPQRRQAATNRASYAQQHNDALHSLASGSRDLIRTIQSLSALNIEATLPSLPKFVVVGDQSAGKSSIIEACCDITLPRSEGTCTRCPFEITASALTEGASGGWRCTISLVLAYAYLPSHHPQEPFGQWHATQKEITTFAVVNDKSQLEHQLKLAQLAILNPDTDAATFATLRDPSQASTTVAFSPNIIRLEVQAPELPELSFFDLPGAINVHPNATQQHLVGFIKALIKSYLRDPQTKILLTCGADQDVENCTAFRFIQDSNAINRCIGVLTKLDLIHVSRIRTVERMLNRTDYALPQGSWFVTKQLSQSDLEAGISHGEARNIERSFFDQPHWQRIVQDFPQQVGISNLQQAISQIYTGTIRNHLPEIIRRVNARYTAITQELSGFAEEPQYPTYMIIDEIQKVVSAITNQLSLVPGSQNYYQRNHGFMTQFALDLKGLRPSIDWTTPGYVTPAFSINTSDDEQTPSKIAATPASKVKAKTKAAIPSLPTRKREAPTEDTPGRTTARKLFARQTPARAAVSPVAYTLAQLKEAYETHNANGVDSNNDFVTNRTILAALQTWTTCTTALLSRVQTELVATLTAALLQTLPSRVHTDLYATLQRLILAQATELLARTGNTVHRALHREQDRPVITASKKTWDALKAVAGRELLKARQRKLVDEVCDEHDAVTGKHTGIDARQKHAADPKWAEAHLDAYAGYVKDLAPIFAYYDVVAPQFADNVAKIVTYELLKEFRETIGAVLRDELPVRDEDACKALVAEEPGREALRAKLKEEKDKLEMARAELEKVGGLV
ncbi:hypothetical protein LTR95_000987 [Oleoguttula sp. CCFEE 5521]